ncbi:putative nuclease HARBI1 [Acropora millepora]|uniref:putative nuclease HARBI1 n=1 Tax=Acropora millepora TaxID=45264 RepID=UPI001CF210B4|nr:putative nuclease HARBI1 [Acropora millepora]
MSSSSEEELDELLRRQVMRQPRNFEERRLFDIENPREFREKFRLPVDAFVHLLELIGPRLEHRTRRNRPLTARQQLLVFLHFLGTNSFYHVMHSCHGISTSTVWQIIHRVVPVILSFKREFIRWPDQPLSIAAKFRDIAGFPCVAGCVDGTHVPVNPPHNDEDAYVNRHHSKSLNVAMVAGPDYTIYFCSSRCPGRWHDSRVIKESTLWTAFEQQGYRPFPEAVILGDSAYACNNWLIPPFRGDVEGARHSDNGDDLLDDEDLDIVDDELDIDHGEEQQDRRQQLLQHFL